MSGTQQFTLLPVPMPPMLPGIIGIVDTQYFSIFYQGSKATWSNGRAMGTFSYYAVYAPLIEHPALAIHLEEYNLGSDDEPPEHAILCDCAEQKMRVGKCREIDRFFAATAFSFPIASVDAKRLGRSPKSGREFELGTNAAVGNVRDVWE